ncbi:chromosome segregation ATPase [Chrysochromulina tobinii]|uniref:Chromosome segregation ATPase n=1 Tax=Chrysochromulina tobinii TaxID=1460289 RepID=A0A0M0J9U7_9EUKA|nr:chromosome segregation ATPase [Chrysochromulina tobinii]|eukprot:KOO23265.1 chromosome segregation ATPase [Chrysochromulina sp. CCMP291]
MPSAHESAGRRPPATRLALLLHRVHFKDFKSFAGHVVVGPFDARTTTIVGPNGSGKSCLVEGVCFALAVGSQQLRAPALGSLVNHGSTTGNAAVAVTFAEAGGPRCLVVQRRIVGGCRSECTCAATSMKRDELRHALRRLLALDIDQPERFVVHQTSVMSVASKSPSELLQFLEGVLGTAGLRAGVLEEAARSLELSEAVSSLEEILTVARADKAMHAKSFEAYRALEESRRAFAALQFRHLKRELAFLACSLVSSDARRKAARCTLQEREGVLVSAREGAQAVEGRLKASGAAKTRAHLASSAAGRMLARLREESTRMQLRRKQALASECRTAKAAAAVRMQVHALGEEERTAAIEEAQALATARRSGESLALSEAVLEARPTYGA